LETAKKAWEEETKLNRVTVTEDNVAEVVSMMSGVPVQRISQNEGEKLVKMVEQLKGKVIGQDDLNNLDEDTLYFVISALNQLDIDYIRNKILLKVLPLKV
ncbi:MAG: hypothetical protein EBX23_05310, partial [Proteobacteria bacterium]|nr:hypothetical protein [Pseudomonadota bacterium]